MKHFVQWVLALGLCVLGFSACAGAYDDFFKALEFDNAQEVQRLLARGMDPNTPNEQGAPALTVATRSGAIKSAMLLAQHPQTLVNVMNSVEETPLMLAALNNQLNVAQVLIERGAEVNRKGWTPLHYAATKGHIAMMRVLLENNAYIDAESPNGTTPLMMAAFYGTPLSVKLLLEEGADPTPRNQSHVNALDLALKAERQQSAYYIRAFTEAWVIKESGE
jgi:uncharacterized protein